MKAKLIIQLYVQQKERTNKSAIILPFEGKIAPQCYSVRNLLSEENMSGIFHLVTQYGDVTLTIFHL